MINITENALDKVKLVLGSNTGKFPRIVIKKGGCAGTMLVLTLDFMHDNDIIIESNGVKFAVAEEAKCYIEDITIYTKSTLGTSIMIKNNIRQSCRCGKSFKA